MLDLLEAPGGYDPGAPVDPLRGCSRCGEPKTVDEFPIKNKATGLRSVWCRSCRRAYGKEHYEKNRAAYIARASKRKRTDRPRIRACLDEYLRSHPCVDCGSTDITVLEFDHRDPALKDLAIGRLKTTATWSRILREIAKCDVRCANCHRLRTSRQFRWVKATGVSIDPADGPRPGTAGRYRRIAVVRQDTLFASSDHGLRRCSVCRELKPVADFAFRDMVLGARDYYCRPCRRAYRRGHYERNRSDYVSRALREMKMKREDALSLIYGYLGNHPCVDCGETDLVLLEFDHVDPTTKTAEVACMVGRRSWPVISAEIAKCVVRCANCHRRRTARQRGWKARLAELGVRYGRIDVLAGVA